MVSYLEKPVIKKEVGGGGSRSIPEGCRARPTPPIILKAAGVSQKPIAKLFKRSLK
jgi:hypothetical protein